MRIMRNKPPTDNITVTRALAELTARVPATWQVKPRLQAGRQQRPDAVVDVTAPDGRRTTLLIEVKRSLDPKDVDRAIEQLRRWAEDNPGALVVAAPFLGGRTRARIQALGAGYIDLTGNIMLSLDEPALYIEREGAAQNPDPRERPARSLKGAKAARIVRALVDFRTPLRTRQLAGLTGSDPGYVSRVLDLLDREGLIGRQPRGPVERVNWSELLVRWTQDYSVVESNRTSSYLDPRGLDALVGRLRDPRPDFPEKYALTGSLAVPRAAVVAPARMAMVYVDDAEQWAAQLSLTPTSTGANVLLIEPADTVAFERTREVDGLRYVALSQAAADLLNGPGRNPGEGEALLAWMRENESEWRVQV